MNTSNMPKKINYKINYPDIKQLIQEIIDEHGFNGRPIYKDDGSWGIEPATDKDRFIYNLKGGDRYFSQLIVRRYMLKTHELWFRDGTINVN